MLILTNMKKGNKEKSNRAQADFFELLVGQYICFLYNIRFSYSKDLSLLIKKILIKSDGAKRLKLQTNNFLKVKKEIKTILDAEIKEKGKIVEVLWLGRKLTIVQKKNRRIQSTSDVDAEHISKKKTRFSVKSIASTNNGTLKNLGQKTLELFYKFSFEGKNDEMFNKLNNHICKITGEKLKTKVELKKKAKANIKILKWATKNGKKYQKLLNNSCFEYFSSLSQKDKRIFINFITDSYDENLYVIIVNSSTVVIYKAINKQTGRKDNIFAKKTGNVGYTIYINKVPAYRVQTNNTNGIGISAFCQRIFLI